MHHHTCCREAFLLDSPLLTFGLYAITDPTLLPGKSLLPGVESALRGGCRLIQYRDKTASETELLKSALSLKDLCLDYQARLIINDDLDLCLRVKADGVHLGKTDGNIIAARKRLGAEKILGVTCHSDLDYAQQSIIQGVDYCAFGRIFTSKTKPNAPRCSSETLTEASNLDIPVVAIGGVTVENAHTLVATKIHNIAVIHGLFGQTDIEASARVFSSLFTHSNFKHLNTV